MFLLLLPVILPLAIALAEINLLAAKRRGGWTRIRRGGYNGNGAVLRSRWGCESCL